MTEISRRQLMASGTAILAVASLPALAMPTLRSRRLYASAYSDREGQHYIALINGDGALHSAVKVASRGHSSCFSADKKRVAFFARRPGRWLKVLDVDSGAEVASIQSASGRHFFGHGVFSPDNRYLYAVENDYESATGLVGVYDATQSYKRVQEIKTGGIGPHEVEMLSDGKTLVVANGGIETHPDYGRRKLNLETMQPNLSYVNVLNGEIEEVVSPPHHQLSLRHLDVNANDDVVVGAQYQGDPRDQHSLVYVHQRGKPLKALKKQTANSLRDLNQYIASVSFSASGTYVMTSAPRGDRVSVWTTKDWSWLEDIYVSDVGGVAPIADSSDMVLSAGDGSLYRWFAPGTQVKKMSQLKLQWDNHMRMV